MIGNSVRSDIAPVLELGGAGIHVPYHVTWALETAELEESHPRLAQVTEIRQAPAALDVLAARLTRMSIRLARCCGARRGR